jgi:hypothetical protein
MNLIYFFANRQEMTECMTLLAAAATTVRLLESVRGNFSDKFAQLPGLSTKNAYQMCAATLKTSCNLLFLPAGTYNLFYKAKINLIRAITQLESLILDVSNVATL